MPICTHFNVRMFRRYVACENESNAYVGNCGAEESVIIHLMVSSSIKINGIRPATSLPEELGSDETHTDTRNNSLMNQDSLKSWYLTHLGVVLQDI